MREMWGWPETREMPEVVESFDYLIRTQFSFQVDEWALSCILDGLAEQEVNVNAYFHTKLDKEIHLVKIVLGSSTSEKIKDLQAFRRVMRSYGLPFKERQVIQVIKLPAGQSGQLNDLFGALWCELLVESMYLGENTNVFLDTSDLERAIEKLSEAVLVLCPKRY
ncbi:hypothetical protein M3936_22360 [Sutcliffiella horikoshii]|uniref:hypothetical protein n=1 Tax=Sutcliffiella horikoshii TaxID=79883 RepID=UPI0007D06753|nr:hypothetical protein [Sutcliffiella horikoshii]MCM3620306.1 hypothetical protein [Sutcliffiella horikoshii]